MKLFALAFLSLPCLATDWHAYTPCADSAAVLQSQPMRLNVRVDLRDARFQEPILRAERFWEAALDVSFAYSVDACAIKFVEALPNLLGDVGGVVARAQMPGNNHFGGLIAIHPNAPDFMSADELTATFEHELGHLFGLEHNPSLDSIMNGNTDAANVLDAVDLAALARLHALRANPKSL